MISRTVKVAPGVYLAIQKDTGTGYLIERELYGPPWRVYAIDHNGTPRHPAISQHPTLADAKGSL